MATEAMSTSTGPLDRSQIQRLRDAMQGTVLAPGDDGYDAARTLWNAMIDRRPALIARCTSAADVAAAVRFGREHGLLVSMRGGGHNVAGSAVCDDGLMIDLSPMKGIEVDPQSRTAQAEPGVLWQEFDRATQQFNLATVGGVVGTTGVAGLTLGGGQGWLNGKHGLTCDNLLAADVVLADGTQVRASAAENADLFWALRGAGANFGVVTSFEYRLHEVGPQILGGLVIHPADQTRDVLRFYREFVAGQPDELTTYAGILTSPDGQPVIAMVPCYVGSLEAGERALAPLRAFGSPVVDTVAPCTYTDQQAIMTAGFPHGRLNYWKSGLAREITDDAIEVLAAYAATIPSPFSAIAIADTHGAYSRVGAEETAYAHRDAPYDLVILSSWESASASERNVAWTRELHAALAPHLGSGVYVNDLDRDEPEDRVRSAYGVNYERLVALKTRYDPTNFFRMNNNIKPASSPRPAG
jgi:FAD/FMN-containing dehydrogenase